MTTLLIAVAAMVPFGRGGVRLQDASSYLILGKGGGWLPAWLDRGPLDTLHTGARTRADSSMSHSVTPTPRA